MKLSSFFNLHAKILVKGGIIIKNSIIPKRVELSELFYDLVFVYAISKLTSFLDEPNLQTSLFTQLITFSIVTIVFINIWMVETVYTNRFGRNSVADILLFMLEMAILLFMSNSFTGNLNQWFQPFAIAASSLSSMQVLQYSFNYFKSNSSIDKRISFVFIIILGLRSLFLLIGGLLPLTLGVPTAIVGILISWILPGMFKKPMAKHPINFPHLIERLTSLIIIMFGEMIVDVSSYFTVKSFSLNSILIFIIVCSLFMTYITQFDHYLDNQKGHETGIALIYLHYFILFGLMLITSALIFIRNAHMSLFITILFLYIGLSIFYLGIFLASPFNKTNLKLPKPLIFLFGFTTIVGGMIGLLATKLIIILLVTALITFINSFWFSAYMVKRSRKLDNT